MLFICTYHTMSDTSLNIHFLPPNFPPLLLSLPYPTAEIDRVMKKVDEGVELFDEIWEKVYSAEQQNQKEKYEVELKKEIKKLQRLRDQIKTWIGGSEVKDKDALLEARRLIETKMEQFKVCEKETKTKTYSKEGLARAERLDPEEQKKEDTIAWIGEIIEQIQGYIDEKDLEIEKLSSGKGKKTNKNQLDECNQHMENHKFHLNKLEGIMRLVRNDRIPAETVDELREDLEYYCDSHQDDDYIMAYDEDAFYETLGLDELDVVNVDRVTQVPTTTKKKDDDATSASSGSKKSKSSKNATAATGMIPLTIGRARVSKADKAAEAAAANATPTKIGRSSSTASSSSGPAPVAPTPKAPSAPAAGGASMAAVLKRESEERQKAALAAQQQVSIFWGGGAVYWLSSRIDLSNVSRHLPLQRLFSRSKLVKQSSCVNKNNKRHRKPCVNSNYWNNKRLPKQMH